MTTIETDTKAARKAKADTKKQAAITKGHSDRAVILAYAHYGWIVSTIHAKRDGHRRSWYISDRINEQSGAIFHERKFRLAIAQMYGGGEYTDITLFRQRITRALENGAGFTVAVFVQATDDASGRGRWHAIGASGDQWTLLEIPEKIDTLFDRYETT